MSESIHLSSIRGSRVRLPWVPILPLYLTYQLCNLGQVTVSLGLNFFIFKKHHYACVCVITRMHTHTQQKNPKSITIPTQPASQGLWEDKVVLPERGPFSGQCLDFPTPGIKNGSVQAWLSHRGLHLAESGLDSHTRDRTRASGWKIENPSHYVVSVGPSAA